MPQAQTEIKRQLDFGEKYLSISLLGSIKLVAFKNSNKKEATDPDFVGNGIAIWINSKKPKIISANELV